MKSPEAYRRYHQTSLRGADPKRGGYPHQRRVYAEMFVDPITSVGRIPLVQMTGLSYRTLIRITRREVTAITEDTAERLCIALGLEFHDLPYVYEVAS